MSKIDKISKGTIFGDSLVNHAKTISDIYVDSVLGDDAAGIGTQALPFKTLTEAGKKIETGFSGDVKIYASGTFLLTNELNFNNGSKDTVEIIGDVKEDETGTITSSVTTVGSTYRSSITDSSKTWSVDEWKDKIVSYSVGGNYVNSVIYSNTADTLVIQRNDVGSIDSATSFTIYHPITYIRADTTSTAINKINLKNDMTFKNINFQSDGGYILKIVGNNGNVIFDGCIFNNTTGALTNSSIDVDIEGGSKFTLMGCLLKQANFNIMYCNTDLISSLTRSGGGPNDGGTFAIYGSPKSKLYYTTFYNGSYSCHDGGFVEANSIDLEGPDKAAYIGFVDFSKGMFKNVYISGDVGFIFDSSSAILDTIAGTSTATAVVQLVRFSGIRINAFTATSAGSEFEIGILGSKTLAQVTGGNNADTNDYSLNNSRFCLVGL